MNPKILRLLWIWLFESINRLRKREREKEKGGRTRGNQGGIVPVRTEFLASHPHCPARADSPPADNLEEPMQLGRAKLTPVKCRRRFEGRLCLYCGCSGHFVASCPALSKGSAHQ